MHVRTSAVESLQHMNELLVSSFPHSAVIVFATSLIRTPSVSCKMLHGIRQQDLPAPRQCLLPDRTLTGWGPSSRPAALTTAKAWRLHLHPQQQGWPLDGKQTRSSSGWGCPGLAADLLALSHSTASCEHLQRGASLRAEHGPEGGDCPACKVCLCSMSSSIAGTLGSTSRCAGAWSWHRVSRLGPDLGEA